MTEKGRPLSRRRRLLYAMAALSMSVFLSVAVAELVIRLVAPQNLNGTWRVAGRRVKIRADAVAQVDRLAHVDDVAALIFHEVNARFLRQRSQLLLQRDFVDHPSWVSGGRLPSMSDQN